MKTKLIFIALMLVASPVTRIHAEGIPEPGLVLYGAIRNAATGNSLLISGTLTWNVQAGPGGPVVALTTSLANLNNGLYSYRVRIPYESVVGGNALGPNSFALPSATTAFNRSLVLVAGGQTIPNVVILGSATAVYNFSATTRGAVERVDLQINVPGLGGGSPLQSASQSVRTGPTPVESPSFWFLSMGAHTSGGVLLEWGGSLMNKSYRLLRAEQMTGAANDFETIATFPPLSGGTVTFWDTTAISSDTYFYHLKAE